MGAVFVQAVGFAAMAFCIGSYQVKSGRGLILCKTTGDLLYVVHYLLLGSYRTGRAGAGCSPSF